jgi:hypothetical protein
LEPKITGTVKDDDDGSCGNEDLFDLAIDLEKVRPVSRLGYSQEYTVILEDVPHRLTRREEGHEGRKDTKGGRSRREEM